MAGKQTSVPYGGYNIVQVQYNGTFDKSESMGFTIDTVFAVQDDFGDFTLPTTHQTFWTPHDARAAIDTAERINQKFFGRKWPTSVAHEYNIVVNYRRHFPHVMQTLAKIETLCKEARDFEEDATAAVLQELAYLRQHCLGAAK